jgi:hypothetical protein
VASRLAPLLKRQGFLLRGVELLNVPLIVLVNLFDPRNVN